MAPSTTQAARAPGALLAGLAAVALLALVTTWAAALARMPQQRAAVENLLRAQTGLDVRYGRLAVRLGFYGPEAEFGNVEMRRPGAAAPLLRAPRMVARFEIWRLLRGGQLRPGRVLVSGAELDLRQLLELRRGTPAAGAAPAGRAVAAGAAPGVPPGAGPAQDAPTTLDELESRLPRLLAGIPEGSLDFEAVTLLWSDGANRGEPLQLRAPRLHASRRVDGAQLSGTLLLPERLGRTLFVATQLRDAGAAHGGLQGRVRVSGRGLVLARWREAGLLPDWIGGGVGDLSFAAQLRDGRVLHADGEARLAGLGLATAAPLVARRFRVAAAEFAYDRLPGARRYRLQRVEMVPLGGSAPVFGESGALELRLGDAGGAGTLVASRLPVELLGFLAARAGVAPWGEAPPLRLSGGEFESFEARWTDARSVSRDGAGAVAPPVLRGSVVGLALGSADGDWSLDGVDVVLAGEGGKLQLQLAARDPVLRAPWLEALATPPRLALNGRATLGIGREGWSAALEQLEVAFADGPRLLLSGSVGAAAARAAAPSSREARPAVGAADTATLRLALAEPLPRERMALLQTALEPWLPPRFWQRFVAGRIESASAEFTAGRLASARASLRAASFAAADALPEARDLDLELDWDGTQLAGLASAGKVGPLALESGRGAWSPADLPTSVARRARPRLALEARLVGALHEALQLAQVGVAGSGALDGIDGRAQVDARWRMPEVDAAPARARALELEVEVSQARWQPVPGVAALEGLTGRLRADGAGLRDGRITGRWLGGPVQLRLDGKSPDGLRIVADGRLDRAELQREWAWVELVERGGADSVAWSAEARADPDAPAVQAASRRARNAPSGELAVAAPEAATPWRVRLALPGTGGADLRWTPAEAGWRLDRGTVQFGDGPALAGIPGALVVGGRIERLDLAGLAAALGGAAGGAGWQRPLVGEVALDALDVGATRLGAARLRLAGSRESTSIDLEGPALSGELRQRHAEPGVLQARFARLQLPADAPLASLPLAAGPLRGTLELRVADLRRGPRSLGELVTTITIDDAAIATRDFALRRGGQRLGASGRCERATLGCSAEVALAGADLGELQRDLGHAPRLRGGEAAALGQLGWSMAPGMRFAASLRGELEFSAALAGLDGAPSTETDATPLEGEAVTAATGEDGEAGVASDWSLLAPLVAVVTRQAEDAAARAAAAAARQPSGAAPPPVPGAAEPAAAAVRAVAPALPFERLDLRLAIDEGVARIERYEAVGRDARLSIAGRFDFRRGELEQQADWYWIAPGVSGAVERLDPRSPLAAGLRTLRELLARAPRGTASAGDVGQPAPAERFVLAGPLSQPRVERPALLDSTP